MNEHIEQLVVLQEIDLEIDKIDGEIQAVQEELDARIRAMVDKEKNITLLEATIAKQQNENKMLEIEMEEKMNHVRERQAKMMQVQTDREHTALFKEIEDAKKAAKENEEKIVAILEEVESLTATVTEEKNLLKGEKQLVSEETEKVRLAIEEINKAKKIKTDKRDKQAAEVNPAFLKKYETLRQRRNGVAIVNVLDGVCQGCYMAIPPQRYNMLLKGDQMFDCPTCQRIMYHEPPAE